MYKKLRDLCSSLNVLSKDDLKENGVEALVIMGIDTKLHGFEFVKGDLPTILSMYGSGLARAAKTTGIPLKNLLADIYENERKLEQDMEEGD